MADLVPGSQPTQRTRSSRSTPESVYTRCPTNFVLGEVLPDRRQELFRIHLRRQDVVAESTQSHYVDLPQLRARGRTQHLCACALGCDYMFVGLCACMFVFLCDYVCL